MEFPSLAAEECSVVYMYTMLPFPFIHQWTLKLVPHLGFENVLRQGRCLSTFSELPDQPITIGSAYALLKATSFLTWTTSDHW